MKLSGIKIFFGGTILQSAFFSVRESNGFSPSYFRPDGVLSRKKHISAKRRHSPYGFGRSLREQDRKTVSISAFVDSFSTTETLSFLGDSIQNMGRDEAEQLAGPFFGASLFPYLAFLWLLAREENQCPKGVTVGFATCLLFVFLTIPAAIASQVLYGVSLADSDWLHGSAESLLTVTNLVTVVAFRQALNSKEKNIPMPLSATSWKPMTFLVIGLTALVAVTAVVPAVSDPLVHTKYLGGFMDLPFRFDSLGANTEPDNALSITTWIIHISSLVEFLVAMGFAWRWATVVDNKTWKGLTWGLLPLHSSGITACTYHIFYNQIPFLVPLQALLTCVGNTTAALATYRIARSNGWKPEGIDDEWISIADRFTNAPIVDADAYNPESISEGESESLVGFEDLGQALAGDNDYSFLIKLFAGCAVASYVIKYGETYFGMFYEANLFAGLAFIFIPSGLNAYKWYRRGQDPSFEGWF
mmetsp:Transcript_16969/g.46614  ORF Transcript_16969/g.46614 Transcript_16969/m.46614 type:complete len:473 (-) Transcript_16969:1582-3000(-)